MNKADVDILLQDFFGEHLVSFEYMPRSVIVRS